MHFEKWGVEFLQYKSATQGTMIVVIGLVNKILIEIASIKVMGAFGFDSIDL